MLRWKKLSRSRKVMLAIPFLLMCSFVGMILHQRYWRVWSIPEVGEPFDTVAFLKQYDDVKENAFEDYELAHDQFVEMPVEIRDTISTSTEYNAHVLDWDSVDPLWKKWLAENRTTLQLWMKGTQKDIGFEHAPRNCDYETILPLSQDCRYFTQLALLEAARFRDEGDLRSAWKMHRAILNTTHHLRHGFLISHTIASHLYSIQQEPLGYLLADEKMTLELLHQIAQEHRQMCEGFPDIKTAMQFNYVGASKHREKIMKVRSLRAAVFNEQVAYQRVVNLFYQNMLTYCDLPRWQRPEVVHVSAPVTNRLSFLQKMGNEILSMGIVPAKPEWWETSDYSYFVKEDDFPPMPHSEEALKDSLNLLGFSQDYFMAGFNPPQKNLFTIDNNLICQDADAVQIQLHIYHRQHGHFPEILEELVPDYLSELPRDPFNQGKPIQYRRDEQGALLWSFGLNETDEGGLIVPSGKEHLNEGDIVFQVHAPGTKPPVSKPAVKAPAEAEGSTP